jgi:hypothetical protein
MHRVSAHGMTKQARNLRQEQEQLLLASIELAINSNNGKQISVVIET